MALYDKNGVYKDTIEVKYNDVWNDNYDTKEFKLWTSGNKMFVTTKSPIAKKEDIIGEFDINEGGVVKSINNVKPLETTFKSINESNSDSFKIIWERYFEEYDII